MEPVAADLSEVPQLLRKADAAMKPPGFWGSIFGKDADYDNAQQLYVQCAQRYKLSRMFKEAAECYNKAAVAASKGDDSHAESTMYQECANCVKRYDLAASVPYFRKSIEILLRNNRMGAAAKIYKSLAEDFSSYGDLDKSTYFYKEASKLFELDEFGKTQYSQCICKYAELIAMSSTNISDNENTVDDEAQGEKCGEVSASKRLEEAAEIFESEGYKASDNNLLQFGAKDLFFKSMIIRMANGCECVDLKIYLDRYCERNSHFYDSRECTLLNKLIFCIEDKDVNEFTTSISNYDNITKLDKFKIHFLLLTKIRYFGESNDSEFIRSNNDSRSLAPTNSMGHIDLS